MQLQPLQITREGIDCSSCSSRNQDPICNHTQPNRHNMQQICRASEHLPDMGEKGRLAELDANL